MLPAKLSILKKKEKQFFSKVLGLTGDKILRTREGREEEITSMLKVKMKREGSGGQVWSVWCV